MEGLLQLERHPEHPRPRLAELAGPLVGDVAELVGDPHDPGPGRLARAGHPRMTMETNAVEIPAAFATSAIVGRVTLPSSTSTF